MERKIKPVLKIFSSHTEAEQSDEQDWSLLTGEERLEEWSKLYDSYCLSRGIKVKDGRAIQMVVRKSTLHAF